MISLRVVRVYRLTAAPDTSGLGRLAIELGQIINAPFSLADWLTGQSACLDHTAMTELDPRPRRDRRRRSSLQRARLPQPRPRSQQPRLQLARSQLRPKSRRPRLRPRLEARTARTRSARRSAQSATRVTSTRFSRLVPTVSFRERLAMLTWADGGEADVRFAASPPRHWHQQQGHARESHRLESVDLGGGRS